MSSDQNSSTVQETNPQVKTMMVPAMAAMMRRMESSKEV